MEGRGRPAPAALFEALDHFFAIEALAAPPPAGGAPAAAGDGFGPTVTAESHIRY